MKTVSLSGNISIKVLGVPSVFRHFSGVPPMFRRCSVLHCSVIRCSWFYGMPKNNYLELEKNFAETLTKHAPKKAKIFRGNHKPHINKTLKKAIIKRSQLKGALLGLRRFLATESPLKIMKNAFCFTLKALFVLKMFKFLF